MGKETRILYLAIVLFCVISCSAPSYAIDISASGSWSPSQGASDLAAGAGSDLVASIQSNTDQVLVSINNTLGNGDLWRIDVRRSDISWPAGLTLYAARTGAGTGGGSISGGTSYQAISTSDASFFSGAGDRTGITVQLKMTGMSVTQSPGSYSTSMILTVVDI